MDDSCGWMWRYLVVMQGGTGTPLEGGVVGHPEEEGEVSVWKGRETSVHWGSLANFFACYDVFEFLRLKSDGVEQINRAF